MKLDEKKVSDAYDEAKKLVKNFDSEFMLPAFKIIFKLLLLEDDLATTETRTKKLTLKKPVKSGTTLKQGPMDQLKDLISEDYFSTPRSMKEILEELDSRGRHYRPTDLTYQLNTLVRNKNLRRIKKKIGNKTVLHWTNW